MSNNYVEKMVRGFEDEFNKIAAARVGGGGAAAKLLVPAAGGAALTLAAIRANNDRKMGKQLRLQQAQQGY